MMTTNPPSTLRLATTILLLINANAGCGSDGGSNIAAARGGSGGGAGAAANPAASGALGSGGTGGAATNPAVSGASGSGGMGGAANPAISGASGLGGMGGAANPTASAASGSGGTGGAPTPGAVSGATGIGGTGGAATTDPRTIANGQAGVAAQPTNIPTGGGASASTNPTAALRVKKISAGDSVWCAAMSDGSVRCRDNGDWKTIAGINNAIDVAVGVEDSPSCALLSTGIVKCWGENDKGQLGNGNTTSSNDPVEVSGINNATQVVAGQNFACALLSDGTVKCWGDNGWGQTGNGSWVTLTGFGGGISGPDLCGSNNACALTPLAVSGIANAVQLGVGAAFACAVLANGAVQCWGANIGGTLGNGTDQGPINSSVASLTINPLAVLGISDAALIKSEWYHACVVTKTGTVTCWGANNHGNLGLGTTAGPDTCMVATLIIGGENCAFAPHAVPGLSGVKTISVGANSSCALLTDGTVKCWGLNRDGELGNGTTTDSAIPVPVTGLATAVELEGGYSHFLAILSDGTVVAWGDDTNGRLGQSKAHPAPDLCYLGLANCSKTPIPVSRQLYGETDSPTGQPNPGSNGDPDAGVTLVPPDAGPSDPGVGTTCTAAIQGSCTIGLAGMCMEYAGSASLTSAQSGCTGTSTWSNAACAAANKVGGCLNLIGDTCQTTWYYSTSGVSASTYQSICASSGGTWLTP